MREGTQWIIRRATLAERASRPGKGRALAPHGCSAYVHARLSDERRTGIAGAADAPTRVALATAGDGTGLPVATGPPARPTGVVDCRVAGVCAPAAANGTRTAGSRSREMIWATTTVASNNAATAKPTRQRH
ncbi:MAG TPA: hypothetical protein VGU65_07450 [Frateuria sp.]|uniref:hypothetical protein n=1 Tax=Frateuria sp. TaxID=2211372 RepID=UPI002DEB1897|nr:hypothetical protein [Frateuria sp.]